MSRIAVVLFNLGGPDSLDAVEPFCVICSGIRQSFVRRHSCAI